MTVLLETQIKEPVDVIIPSELKSHPDFDKAKIKIGEQLMYFILPGRRSDVKKEIWQLDTYEATWTVMRLK